MSHWGGGDALALEPSVWEFNVTSHSKLMPNASLEISTVRAKTRGGGTACSRSDSFSRWLEEGQKTLTSLQPVSFRPPRCYNITHSVRVFYIWGSCFKARRPLLFPRLISRGQGVPFSYKGKTLFLLQHSWQDQFRLSLHRTHRELNQKWVRGGWVKRSGKET